MKLLKLIAGGVLLLGLISPVWAANGTALKIGVVDFREVMQQTPKARKAAESLKKQFSTRRDKITAKAKELDKAVAKLKRDSVVMTAAKRDAAEAKLLADKRELQRLREEFQQDYMLAENKMLRQLKKDLASAVDKIVKQEGYDLILPKDHVPYANQALDVTAKIVKAMKS